VNQKSALWIAAALAAFWYYLSTRKTSVTFSQLEPVTGSPGALLQGSITAPIDPANNLGNFVLGADVVTLCTDSPLNSWGAACFGVTWGRRFDGSPYDYRTEVGQGNVVVQPFPVLLSGAG
jgi:hypothetical protein